MTTIATRESYLPETGQLAGLRRRQGLPLVGVIPDLRRNPLRFFVETVRDYGDMVLLDVGFERILMLSRPSSIKHVLQDNRLNYQKSKFVKMLDPILGDGMFLAEGQTWVSQRQTSAPCFQGQHLKAMTRQMRDATSDMIYRWSQKELQSQPVDISQEMMRLALDMVLRSLFSVRLDERFDTVYESLTTILRATEKRFWALVPTPQWLPTAENRDYREALRALDDFVYGIIEERRRNPGDHDDLLSVLLQAAAADGDSPAGRKLLRDQVLSIILAGHDTTANGLAWSWILLSQHLDVARKVRAEVDQVLGKRLIGFDDIPNLPYTRSVFDEAIRLYPPLWTYSRCAMADDNIGGLDIPAGTNVMLCAYAVHRRPELWRDPEGFDPDRFAPEAAQKIDRFAYIPFGGGPRRCLGARFATLEATVALATISQMFQLELIPGQDLEPEPMITLRPRGAVNMRLRPAVSSLH